MRTPSRREFFTYAAAATLASTLPTQAQSKTDQTENETKVRPLVVDVIGPMAFKWSGSEFELWMPDLSGGTNPHQAGIMTPVTSFELPKDNYKISGPAAFMGGSKLIPHGTGGGEIYQCHVSDTSSAQNKYIYMSLPKPYQIVVLDPVSAKVFRKGSEPPNKFRLYAAGVRLLYEQAGVPLLCDPNGVPRSDLVPNGKIPFDPDSHEIQLNMLIGYAPYDTHDPGHTDSRNSFLKVSELFKLDLDVAFEDVTPDQRKPKPLTIVPHVGPLHDCKSLVIGLDGSS